MKCENPNDFVFKALKAKVQKHGRFIYLDAEYDTMKIDCQLIVALMRTSQLDTILATYQHNFNDCLFSGQRRWHWVHKEEKEFKNFIHIFKFKVNGIKVKTSNAVEVHVHHLRKKLGNDIIKTIRGVGYQLSAPPRTGGSA